MLPFYQTSSPLWDPSIKQHTHHVTPPSNNLTLLCDPSIKRAPCCVTPLSKSLPRYVTFLSNASLWCATTKSGATSRIVLQIST